jgi:hypothetical protein
MKTKRLSLLCILLAATFFVGSCGTAPSVVPSPSPESSAASSFSSPTVAPEEPDEKFGSDWLLWLKDYGSDEYRTVSKAELLFKSGGDQAEPSAFFTGNTQQGEPAGFGLHLLMSGSALVGGMQNKFGSSWALYYRKTGSTEPFELVTMFPDAQRVSTDQSAGTYHFNLNLTDCGANLSLKEDGSPQSYTLFFFILGGKNIEAWWQGEVIWNGSSEAFYQEALKDGVALPRRSTPLSFDGGFCRAFFYENEVIYPYADNKESLDDPNKKWALPLLKIDSYAEFTEFKEDIGKRIALEKGYDETSSFADLTKEIDESFFEEKTLFLSYYVSGSGSLRYAPTGVYLEKDSLLFTATTIHSPTICTDDMAGWLFTYTVNNSDIQNAQRYDAVFDHS